MSITNAFLLFTVFFLAINASCDCANDDTCCTTGEVTGCCPFQNAICCSDSFHCCPQGYECTVSNCVRSADVAVASGPKYTIKFDLQLEASCPAGTCTATETCCDLGDGQFGCCPYPSADCCTDHAHCCPNGYTCDLSKGSCSKSTLEPQLSFVRISLTPLIKLPTEVGACPAGTCPSTETCCDLGGGQFGCCPYPSADCCTDHAHCCPNGYTCDISKGTCAKEGASFVTLPLVNIVASCPAGTCPSSETCCDLGGGQFGCCPYPSADCCTDHAHCCPSGYTCDLSKGSCAQGDSFATVPLVSVAAPCPAGSCPSSETCCDLGGGQFGCCPYPSADCCTDHAHCCPDGYTCDLSKGSCVHSTSLALFPLVELEAAASCPAGTCPSTETCCDLGNGQFGCCPYPSADCCTDHSHCCPSGYTCDISKGQCQQSTTFVVMPITPLVIVGSCPAGTCPSTETCCDLGGSQFGCCPYPNADCCTDHAHCCPSGYTCDISKGTCNKDGSLVTLPLAAIVN